HHPWLVRMWCRAGDVHLPTREVDEKEHVVRYQAGRCPDLSGEEVRSDQHLHMRADKLLPRGRRLALGSRRNTMALENVAHGLVTDREAQVGESANDPVIAPGAIRLGHTHDPGLDLLVNHRAARSLTLARAVELLRNELAVPGENGVRFNDAGYFLQGLPTEF